MRSPRSDFVEDVEIVLPANVLDLTKGATYALLWRALDAGVTVAVDSTVIVLTARVGDDEYRQAIGHELVAAGAVTSRPMLRCPDCASRRLSLFWTAPGFRCRRCAGLRYRSQYETELETAARRYGRAMAELDAGPGELSPPRPKRMRRGTYRQRLTHLLEAHSHYRAAVERQVAHLKALQGRVRRAARQEA